MFENNPLAPYAKYFGFTRKRKVPKGIDPTDDRIKATIVDIIHREFESNPDMILTFNCSTEGGKQVGRSAIFSDWFDEEDDTTLTKYDFEFESQNKSIPYSVMLRTDHGLNDERVIVGAVQIYIDSKED